MTKEKELVLEEYLKLPSPRKKRRIKGMTEEKWNNLVSMILKDKPKKDIPNERTN